MTIDKINLGKVYKKQETESKKQQKQIPSYDNNEGQATLAKLRGAAAAHYLATMLGIAASGGMMTSCAESSSEAFAECHNEEEMQVLKDILATLKKVVDWQQKQYNAQLENNAQNQTMIDILNKQTEQTNKITAIVNSIDGTTKTIADAIGDIQVLMIQSNKNDEELQAKIDIIIASNASDSEKLQKLIDLNTEQNATLYNIAALIETLKEQGSSLGDKFDKFYADYTTNSNEFKENDKDQTTLLNKMYEALLASNSNDEVVIAQLTAIINGQNADSDKLAAILEVLNSIDYNVNVLVNKVTELADNVGTFIENYNQGKNDILAELANITKNTSSIPDIDAKMDQVIENQINKQQLL